MKRSTHILRCMVTIIVGSGAIAGEGPAADAQRIRLVKDDTDGALQVLIGGKEAFVYRYGAKEDLAHYWPVRSPSGRSMLVEHPKQYPHHRSFWFADTVKLEGKRQVSFYNAYYSRKPGLKTPGYPDRVRHKEFLSLEATGKTATVNAALVWEMDGSTPVIDERRDMRIVALRDGAYFLDITFTVTAAHGDVTFVSDWVHYAWPYLRMNDTFNVAAGGTITNSEGQVNQKGTNGKAARWVDYSNTVAGTAEGLAVFSHTDNPQPHKWLTRDYGCFGPRRIDARSGKRFTLKNGQSLKRRVGVLVHTGDVTTGNVAEHYEAYIQGKL